jgi:hypothetical protein
VGIVVGTTALNGAILDDLRGRNENLIEDKRGLESELAARTSDVSAADEFALELAPRILSGVLSEQRVLFVTTDSAPQGLVDELTPLLTEAGATVGGRLRLQPDLLDETSAQLLDDLVAQVLPPGVELPEGEPVERASALLGAALLAGPGQEQVAPADAQAVVSAFEEADLVELSEEGEQLDPSDLAVVLTGPAPEEPLDDVGEVRRDALLAVAAALDDRSHGAVVAGPSGSAAEGGVIRALRDDGTVDARVTTVDNVDRVIGQVGLVLALREQVDGGAGRYGTGPNVTTPLPPLPE